VRREQSFAVIELVLVAALTCLIAAEIVLNSDAGA
jgi:hypothetical protein